MTARHPRGTNTPRGCLFHSSMPENRSAADSAPDGGTTPSAPRVRLTDTQRQIIVALCRSHADGSRYATPATNQEIAAEVYLSVDAVKAHLRALYRKFGVEPLPHNQKRARLVELVIEGGYLTPDGGSPTDGALSTPTPAPGSPSTTPTPAHETPAAAPVAAEGTSPPERSIGGSCCRRASPRLCRRRPGPGRPAGAPRAADRLRRSPRGGRPGPRPHRSLRGRLDGGDARKGPDPGSLQTDRQHRLQRCPEHCGSDKRDHAHKTSPNLLWSLFRHQSTPQRPRPSAARRSRLQPVPERAQGRGQPHVRGDRQPLPGRAAYRHRHDCRPDPRRGPGPGRSHRLRPRQILQEDRRPRRRLRQQRSRPSLERRVWGALFAPLSVG